MDENTPRAETDLSSGTSAVPEGLRLTRETLAALGHRPDAAGLRASAMTAKCVTFNAKAIRGDAA